jgi:hypothetical protein
MDSGTVPISGVLNRGLYKYRLMRYTRNTNRYISNAGEWVGIFFFLIPHTAIFKLTNLAGTVACPARFGSRLGTEDAPLVSSGIKDEFISSIL